MKIKKINRRGDLPISILVIGTFAVCAIALLGFVIANIQVKGGFYGPDLMEKMDSKINEYNFYKSRNIPENQIKNYLEENKEGVEFKINGNNFELSRIDTKYKFLFFGKYQELMFSCKYYG